MHLNRGLQNLKRPGVNSGRPKTGFAVEAAYVAVRLVKAHQSVDARDSLVRCIQRGFHLVTARSRQLDLHERAEKRSRSTNSI